MPDACTGTCLHMPAHALLSAQVASDLQCVSEAFKDDQVDVILYERCAQDFMSVILLRS